MKKYYLSTTPYYFIYRTDTNNGVDIRATLYDGRGNIIDDTGIGKLNHTGVINHFEARLSLREIPNSKNDNWYSILKGRRFSYVDENPNV